MRDVGQDFYNRREKNPEFYFKQNHLIHKIKDLEKTIYTFDPSDSPKMSSFLILEILDFTSHYVVLLNWVVKRNILCFRKGSDELVWRIEKPKQIFKTRDNYWCNIRQDSTDDSVVYCYSVDKYRVSFSLETKELVWESFPEGPNFRDF